jgi:hypothetical protein
VELMGFEAWPLECQSERPHAKPSRPVIFNAGSKALLGRLLRNDPNPSQPVTSGFQIDSGQIMDTNLSDAVYVDRYSNLLHECLK